jgi:hypothetical protein
MSYLVCLMVDSSRTETLSEEDASRKPRDHVISCIVILCNSSTLIFFSILTFIQYFKLLALLCIDWLLELNSMRFPTQGLTFEHDPGVGSSSNGSQQFTDSGVLG